MSKVQRYVTSTYFILIGYRHCSELGRVVLNTCVPKGLFRENNLQFVVCKRFDWFACVPFSL